MQPNKTIVGWREKVDFPDWGVTGVLAKIDTGARTSALHVENLQHTTEGRVTFDVVKSRKADAKRKTVVAEVVRSAVVRNSSGAAQERVVVETAILLGSVKKRIQVTLVSRKHMLCRMLLGRTALEGDFVVDVSLRHTAAKT